MVIDKYINFVRFLLLNLQLEYRMPIESIQQRVLQVTAWSHDSLQENEFLGGVELPLSALDLSQELVNWFPLRYLSRS